MPNKRILLLIILLIWFCPSGFSQRYNFEQYDIEDGLTQSQITSISQDSKRQLWITTLGGISCFNGKQFSNYSRINGIASNFSLAITADAKNRIYIGSARGLSRYDGNTFYNFGEFQNWISKLATDKSGTIYALTRKRLFKIGEKDQQLIQISNDSNETVTTIKADPSGTLWAAVQNKGIFFLKNGKWQPVPSDEKLKGMDITELMIDQADPGKIWLVSMSGIYILKSGVSTAVLREIKSHCNAIIQDAKGTVWIGTNSGAYSAVPGKPIIHFNSKNGFTDNVVNEIFRDAEDNIWLGTDGSGIFRFISNGYVTLDETQGIESRIAMAIAKGPEPETIWIGTYGGLYEYSRKAKISALMMPSKDENAYRINFLYHDSKNRIWIGTPGGGLWVHQKGKIMRADQPDNHLAYNAVLEDKYGKIWLSTNYGCLVYDPLTKKQEQVTKQFGGSLLEIGRDSIISGTQDGPLLIVSKKAAPMNIKALNGSSILCMLKDGNHILFGTADYGLIIWNQKTGTTKSLNSKSGLVADHIYSILKDTKGTIWLGTGKGINRLNSTNYSIINTGSEDVPLVECNQNAIMQYKNTLWIGTTKGVLIFNLDPQPTKRIKPYIFISSLTVSSSGEKLKKSDTSSFLGSDPQLRQVLVLPHHHNHITINYTGIHLANPKDISYQYRLIGLDDKYSLPGSSTSMSFTAIPSGKYTFQVRVITNDGLISNTAAFSFEILPSYYQTNIFRFFVILLIILIILLAVYIILTVKERRRKLRLKIKMEEQFNIRKQTAEDFHDDLGNKLTRISVLSEVLSSMIDQSDTEKKVVLQKISNNVNELYSGTKDILWSLNPKNDTLEQLLNHIKEFGTEMFNETSVLFEHEIDVSKGTKLSLDMSRNMLMIFKESIHNVLKHANAKRVSYKARLNDEMLLITLEDDGQGFDTAYGKNGHGINNMYVRARRINADLKVTSGQNGTAICLIVKFSTLAHFKNV